VKATACRGHDTADIEDIVASWKYAEVSMVAIRTER